MALGGKKTTHRLKPFYCCVLYLYSLVAVLVSSQFERHSDEDSTNLVTLSSGQGCFFTTKMAGSCFI